MDILDEMKLPHSSEQEELEQLSKDRLRPLFGHKHFEVREETYRDKGIDLLIELKHKGRYTNFRFLVQLKSSGTKKQNKDTSFSWQIETSNVQYLLNSGQPAYYICYVKEKDQFYYKNINEFVTHISSKSKHWDTQKSHVLRVSNILNSDSVAEIYDNVKNRCQLSRMIVEKFDIGGRKDDSKKISISGKYEVTDETSIVSLIENIGFQMINEGRSKDIVLLNERVSNEIKSPIYNLIVGAASYYTSNLFDALALFQKARREIKRLDEEFISNLEYYDAIVKFSLGLISDEEYRSKIDSLKNTENLKFYIKLEKAKEDYLSTSFSDDGFKLFKKELFELIEDDQADSHIKFIAKCEYLLHWGKNINMDFFHSTSRLIVMDGLVENIQDLRIEGARYFIGKNKEWSLFCKELDHEISEKKDFFAFNMSILNQAKVRFELMVITIIIQQYNGDDKAKLDNTETSGIMLKNLETVAKNYKKVNHIENLLVTLATQYEIYHFMLMESDANFISKEMQGLIELYDLKEQKSKIDYLLKGGTTGEQLQELFKNTVIKSEEARTEYSKLVDEMKSIDELEKESKEVHSNNETVIVNLFPIGYFLTDRLRINEFYEILGIDSYKLIKHLEYFFDNGIIPVLNIFNDVNEEGYCNGMLDSKGIESWRKIKDIRVRMYEMKFFRNDAI